MRARTALWFGPVRRPAGTDPAADDPPAGIHSWTTLPSWFIVRRAQLILRFRVPGETPQRCPTEAMERFRIGYAGKMQLAQARHGSGLLHFSKESYHANAYCQQAVRGLRRPVVVAAAAGRR
ncbi:hypothetical protein XFF6992_460046 [Xanthomonas citri pv. fuscans]|nr:hypothetical protein XFF7767_990043 [Xanthomonas citri pv. fuscans]SOO12513.1 hypothetical protein XFF7766_1110044 [Xanthomonas citri pv. fuscans]SOO20416.1 hypothetical protein XFF6992_460046 [Xanthomonas citri pv. fuscans]